MAMNRNTAVGLFSLIALAVGVGLGWLIFAPKNNGNGSKAGKDCTMADGVTKGKTDNAGVCKA